MQRKMQVFYIGNQKDLERLTENQANYKEPYVQRFGLILDFRDAKYDIKSLEKSARKYQLNSCRAVLCKIDANQNVWIEIRREEDYLIFFQEFVTGGKIKQKYCDSKFNFYIYLDSKVEDSTIDEQRLYYFFLIANKYGREHFSYKVLVSKGKTAEMLKDENYYRISAYSSIQRDVYGLDGRVRIGDKEDELRGNAFHLVGRIFPLFTVTKDSFKIFQTPIDRRMWRKIRRINLAEMGKIEEELLENMLLKLCHRYLFDDYEQSQVLEGIRKTAFLSPDFFKLIKGIPLIALLIFAEFDSFSRKEMLKEYRKKTDKNVQTKDLLDDCQKKQEYETYCAHLLLRKGGMDNKSVLRRNSMCNTEREFTEIYNDLKKGRQYKHWKELYTTYGLHTQIVTEVYEAVAISEGLLQLMDNVVTHAGQGVMSMRIHCMEDKTVLRERYPSYFLLREHGTTARYFLEVRISDLSGTNIVEKFKKNYPSLGKELDENNAFKNMKLRSFFDPQKEEKEIWSLFYSNSSNIVKHYGLQIFDSIIRSKDGYFTVTSGEEIYQSEDTIDEEEYFFASPGTSYTILLPLDNKISEDKNIYDSMLSYDVADYLQETGNKSTHLFDFSSIERSAREVYCDEACDIIRKMEENRIGVIDVNHVEYLEGIVKGLLLYLFQEKEKDPNKKIYIAFVNCKTYQIVEIVRLICLSYDKVGRNDRMENVQIYIRGLDIGEEIAFFGNTLTEVGNNIMKMACMRGALYDNFQAVDTLLRRR